jgi:hypothetical protein
MSRKLTAHERRQVLADFLDFAAEQGVDVEEMRRLATHYIKYRHPYAMSPHGWLMAEDAA